MLLLTKQPSLNQTILLYSSTDSLGVEVNAPDAGGVGIGSAVNFLVNGDTDI